MKTIKSVNPATGELNGEYELYSADKVEEIIKKSKIGFKEWKSTEIHKRAYYLESVADVLKSRSQDFAQKITIEMGKPIKDAIDEIDKCVLAFEYFAEQAEEFLTAEFVETDADTSGIVFEPLGTILSIMPWNAPFWQPLRFAAPALAGGNVVILKHASYVPQCALAIADLFKEAGVPEGVYQIVLLDGNTASSLIARDEINAVSFTGSGEAGAKVASAAGSNAKKCILELGGSDPFIVLEDADIEKATSAGVKSRFKTAGQRCDAAKRFIVHNSIVEEFTDLFINKIQKLKIGDPMDEKTDMGPLVNIEQAQFVQDQLNSTLKHGANVLLEGGKREGSNYFDPVVLNNIKEGSPVLTEEIFGPIAPILSIRNEQEAIKISNHSIFGLGASIWSNDREKAVRLSKEIEAGVVAINNPISSDYRLPFGGLKKSGFGREMHRIGMHEFLSAKSMKIF